MSSEKLLFRRRVNPKKEKNYGRQVPESEPEKVRPKTSQNPRCGRQEKRGRVRQTGGRQEKVTAGVAISREVKIMRDALFRETSTRPGLAMRR